MELTKSKFTKGVQCRKMLWLAIHKPEAEDTSLINEDVLVRGNEVGDHAMGLFGHFEEMTEYLSGTQFPDKKKMAEKTIDAINRNVTNICEAAFYYNGNYCAVDILRKNDSGNYDIYEVKSSTHVKDIYLWDVAYQKWLVEKCGLTVDKCHVVHINPNYVRHGDLEIDKLFEIVDVSNTIKDYYSKVEGYVHNFNKYVEQEDEPQMGFHIGCTSPYDCTFFPYCSKDLPKPNVFDLNRINKEKACQLANEGMASFEKLKLFDKLSEKQRIQIDSELNKTIVENSSEVAEFLKGLTYPIYFLDFESYQEAIPQYDGEKTYQQMPFQYSLHIIEKEGDEPQHKEFLAEPGTDPRKAIAERLVKDIPHDVCVTAYNKTFECGRLKELASAFPDLADHLLAISNNIVDLIVPFNNTSVYYPAMNGRTSIKVVLPALFPDDDELNYSNLEGVHKGDEASKAFLAMSNMNESEREKIRQQLLKYCGLDTWAMVKIFYELKEIARK